jgi:hypothetical protein
MGSVDVKQQQTRPCAKLTANRIIRSASRCHESAEKVTGDEVSHRIGRALATLRGQKPNAAFHVRELVESFKAREFPAFTDWMKERLQKNSDAVLAPNPSNHIYDVEDPTIDLTVGKRNAARKIEHQKKMTPAYILKQGSFREVLESVSRLPHEQQLEAAMAYLVEQRKGSLLDNAPEYKQFEKKLGQEYQTNTGRMKEGLENPFYLGVCEAILDLFKENGWVKKAARPASRQD